MISIDLNDRVDLPYTVGSTSREGRLHLLMDQAISRRRSFSRDALPRLTKSYSTASLANTKVTVEEEGNGEETENAKGKRTIRIVRKTSKGVCGTRDGPTSVSCPGGINTRHVEADNSSAYITKGGMNVHKKGSKRERRMPSTSNPRMTRQKTITAVSMEKLPPVISEDGTSIHEKEKVNGGPSRLPRVAAGEYADIKFQNINLRVTQRRRSKTEFVVRRKGQGEGGTGGVEVGREGEDHVDDKLQPLPRTRHRRTSDMPHLRQATSDGDSDDDKKKDKPSTRRRKTSWTMKRQSTVGHLPDPVPQEARTARRATIPPSAKLQWYQPRFIKKGEVNVTVYYPLEVGRREY